MADLLHVTLTQLLNPVRTKSTVVHLWITLTMGYAVRKLMEETRIIMTMMKFVTV